MMVILQLIPEASPNIDTNRIESLSLASYFPVTMRFFFFYRFFKYQVYLSFLSCFKGTTWFHRVDNIWRIVLVFTSFLLLFFCLEWFFYECFPEERFRVYWQTWACVCFFLFFCRLYIDDDDCVSDSKMIIQW